MSILMADALAAAPAVGAELQQGSSMSLILMLVVFVAVFYFMLWRPQSKRAKDHRTMVSSLAKGDEVITTGGLLGVITQVGDSYLTLRLADSVEIKLQKQAISAVVPKGTLKAS